MQLVVLPIMVVHKGAHKKGAIYRTRNVTRKKLNQKKENRSFSDLSFSS